MIELWNLNNFKSKYLGKIIKKDFAYQRLSRLAGSKLRRTLYFDNL